MNNDGPKPYETGYKKPPKNTQFRRGQSGNPKGRPRGVKNFSTVLDQELRSRIGITENGKGKVITKREAIAKRTVNNAVQGDAKCTALLINHERFQQSESLGSAGPQYTLTHEDELVLADIVRRIKQTETEPASPDSGDAQGSTEPSDDRGEEL